MSETDELGNVTTIERDAQRYITKITHPDSSTEEMTYQSGSFGGGSGNCSPP